MGDTMNQSDIKPENLSGQTVLKPVLFSILILISGIIIGSGITLMVAIRFDNSSPPPEPEHMSRRMVQRITQELHLSPEQQKQLGPIIKQHMKAMDDIRQEARPKIMEIIKQMNDEVMAILDEGQKQIWKDKSRRMQKPFFPQMHQGRKPGYRQNGRPAPDGFRPEEPRPRRRFRDNRPPEDQRPPEGPHPGGPEEPFSE